jgi:voltage-gated potassium channel Kch
MLLWGGCGRITLPLSRIEFKIFYFFLNGQILFFVILIDNLFIPYNLRDF